MPRTTKISAEEKLAALAAFLLTDFKNDLACLFVAALTWHAAYRDERTPHQKTLAMDAGILHARSVYDFYLKPGRSYYDPLEDNARAKHFAPGWTAESDLYRKYFGQKRSANKRLFHLVYDRGIHSGSGRRDESTHLKNQILEFAKDLLRISRDFVSRVEPQYQRNAETALTGALLKSDEVATSYKIANLLRAEMNKLSGRARKKRDDYHSR